MIRIITESGAYEYHRYYIVDNGKSGNWFIKDDYSKVVASGFSTDKDAEEYIDNVLNPQRNYSRWDDE